MKIGFGIILAHSFGKLYNLPVPFWLYLFGGAAALVISFLIIGYFLNTAKINLNFPEYNLSNKKLFTFFLKNTLWKFLKFLTLGCFILSILTGIYGVDFSYLNFNMTFFWIIFVLGFTYTIAIFGNFYPRLNPFKTTVEIFEELLATKFNGHVYYPKSFNYLPAVIFYMFFISIELFQSTTPSTLSRYLICYFVLNVLGTMAFGKKVWFEYFEFFGVFFKLIGKISIFKVKETKTVKTSLGSLTLSLPFIGLIKETCPSFTLLFFILFMLSSTAFDGIRETIFWQQNYWGQIRDFLSLDLRITGFKISEYLALIISPFIFFIIYFIFIFLSKVLTGTKHSLKELLLKFAYSLIPIAIVYNAAHYYTLLFTEGPNFIRLLSDPFGFGWDIFNTATYSTNLSLVDAGITWHVQVLLILAGHIASVFIAHLTAIQLFKDHKTALISQIPMLLLMVTYTVLGLWILSQPLTGGGL